VLRDSGMLSREALARAEAVAADSAERLVAVVTRLGLVSEQMLRDGLAAASRLPIADDAALRAATPLGQTPGRAISAEFLRDIRAVPFAHDDNGVRVAVVDPFDRFVEQAFGHVYGGTVERLVARASDIDATIERLCGSDAAPDVIDDSASVEDIDRLRDLVSDAPAIRAVNRLIAEAVDARASDIHLEPGEDALVVRFRVDGMLREVHRLPQSIRHAVIARVKVVAGLDIAERRLPQDGRMRVAVRGHEIDLRVATAASIHGESAVLRILDRSKLALDFTTLGFDPDLAAGLRAAVHRPHGIVLVTGPTGSGKTTTLYAALAELNGVERKLLTVEDPIEYRLPGVIQTQVQPAIGLTFASALRSFLRQDPDVIMVGEIRDAQTAEIAVQAALTGHMILSTLHTNTAAGAVGRLIDMKVEPFLLASVLAAVLAQRLVRRLCLECSVRYIPDKAARHDLDLPKKTEFHRPVGCPACNGTGYRGRVALFEFLPIDATLSRLILNRADARTIEEAAGAAGHRTLLQDGYAKAAQGLTSIEEVLRVANDI
jgi:general secretion pathway protein E